MAGEASKTSGEIGEKLAQAILAMIGWRDKLKNVPIPCNTASHINDQGNPRQSHGDDSIFIYHNPFHDDRTDIVHVSVKNKIQTYPAEQTLRTQFKEHLEELHQTIHCAKHDPTVSELCKAYGARRIRQHSGLLIWLQNDDTDIERDIKPMLAKTRLQQSNDVPVYVIDNARASFFLKVVDDMSRRQGDWEYYYPPIGTSVKAVEARRGPILPLELIASDIVPIVRSEAGRKELLLYANEPFGRDTYKKLVAYGLRFASGLVDTIRVGMPDFNPAHDESEAATARMEFSDRPEEVLPFSYARSILNLLQETR
jgi:hypothetical protein